MVCFGVPFEDGNSPTGDETPVSVPEADQADFQYAIDLFNRQEYFECHEVLELLWQKAVEPDLRLLYQGILQIAVGLHHHQKNNPAGAASLLNKGLDKLTPLSEQNPCLSAFAKQIRQHLAGVSDDIHIPAFTSILDDKGV